jgi:hypothetical protein
METCGAVVEHEFEDRSSVAKPLYAGGDDASEHGRGLPHFQFAYGAEAAAIFVSARRMEQKVANGAKAESVEQMCPLTSDAPDRGHWGVEGTRDHGRCARAGRGFRGSGSRHAANLPWERMEAILCVGEEWVEE